MADPSLSSPPVLALGSKAMILLERLTVWSGLFTQIRRLNVRLHDGEGAYYRITSRPIIVVLFGGIVGETPLLSVAEFEADLGCLGGSRAVIDGDRDVCRGRRIAADEEVLVGRQ